MPPKIPAIITCESNEAWEREVRLVGDGLALEESEDTWDRITSAVQRLTALTEGSAAGYPQDFVTLVRSHVRSLTSALNSERSRLSGAATDLIVSLATQLGQDFNPLLPHFGPTLFGLASRSNKLFISRAKASLLAIAEHAQPPNLLAQLREASNSKSLSQRLVVAEVLLKCLNCFDPLELQPNARAEDIESVIRFAAKDASADVRKVSRKLFEAYKILLPQRVNAFIDPLTPVMRKYLDIKPKDAALLSSSSSCLQANLKKSSHPHSASASAATVEIRPSTRPVARINGHVKSATVGSQPAMREAVAGPSTNAVEKRSTTPSEASKPQRPKGTGPMRPPPHLRHAIKPNPEPIRPGASRFPSRPASAQSTESSNSKPPILEPTKPRERARRPPKLEEVPPPTKASTSKSAVRTVDIQKATGSRSKRPESVLSQSSGFMMTSAKSTTSEVVANRGALRVKRVAKDPGPSKVEDEEKGAQRPVKLLHVEKKGIAHEAIESKTRKVKEASASQTKEPPRIERSEETQSMPKPNPKKLPHSKSDRMQPMATSQTSTGTEAQSAPLSFEEGGRISRKVSTKTKSHSSDRLEAVRVSDPLKTKAVGNQGPIVEKSQPTAKTRPGIHAPTLSQLAKKRTLPQANGVESNRAVKKTRRAIEPLAIRKVNRQIPKEQDEVDMLISVPVTSTPTLLDAQEELATIAAAEVPLPQSPPPSSHESSDDGLPTIRFDIPPLPTPLREVSATKYRVAATPISALLFSIERGFDDTMLEGSEDVDHPESQDPLRSSIAMHATINL